MRDKAEAHWKWIEYDLSSGAAITANLYVNGVLRQTLTIPLTAGVRVCTRLIFAPHWWGRLWRLTLSSPAEFEVYGLTAWLKQRGEAMSYRPQVLMALAG